MASLIYSAIASLDGYVEDENGKFDWAEPDEEVHAFINDLARPVGTHLYGRRMYETMVAWESIDDQTTVIRDFAEIWRAAEKVVYSRTLESVSSARTRIERDFDPLLRDGETDVVVALSSREDELQRVRHAISSFERAPVSEYLALPDLCNASTPAWFPGRGPRLGRGVTQTT